MLQSQEMADLVGPLFCRPVGEVVEGGGASIIGVVQAGKGDDGAPGGGSGQAEDEVIPVDEEVVGDDEERGVAAIGTAFHEEDAFEDSTGVILVAFRVIAVDQPFCIRMIEGGAKDQFDPPSHRQLQAGWNLMVPNNCDAHGT